MVVINQFQCHTMQELAVTDKYARFIKRSILLAYMVTCSDEIVSMCIVPVKIRSVNKRKKLPHMPCWIIAVREPL